MNKSSLLIFLAFPVAAYAEVSDKMATVAQLWAQGIIVAIVLLLLVRWSTWFSILALMVIALFGFSTYETFTDPYIGQAILNEQGIPYMLSSYGSVALMLVGYLAGILLNLRKQKYRT